jgi:hypothetical protein
MAACKYCGQPAGFLRGKHAECEQKFERGKTEMLHGISRAIGDSDQVQELPALISEIAKRSHISDQKARELVIAGWTTAVDKFLEDGVLDEAEEKRLMQLKERFSLDQSELDSAGAFSRVAKAAVLRDVLSGTIPERVKLEGNVSLNLQKNEKIVWAFPNCDYLEDKTRRQYVGGSQGVSVRVMKGVYYRVGAFKGHSIERTERVLVDRGLVALTNKHIYFAGPAKSLRVAYAKIVSFQPFSDGLGVIRDAASAKPQIFVTGDGWFTYNLAANLAQL